MNIIAPVRLRIEVEELLEAVGMGATNFARSRSIRYLYGASEDEL